MVDELFKEIINLPSELDDEKRKLLIEKYENKYKDKLKLLIYFIDKSLEDEINIDAT